MASLALMVAIIFLSVIFSGPTIYLIGLVAPRFVTAFLSIPVVLLGVWWLCVVPTWPVNLLGLLPIICCYFAVFKRRR